MKNWMMFLISTLWIIMLIGCSFLSESIPVNEVSDDLDWKNMIPDPYELYDIPGHCSYSSDGIRDEGYQFMLYSATEEDFITYTQKSKEMGFTNVIMEEPYMVLFHDSDMKYTLSIYFTKDEDDSDENWMMVDIAYSQK